MAESNKTENQEKQNSQTNEEAKKSIKDRLANLGKGLIGGIFLAFQLVQTFFQTVFSAIPGMDVFRYKNALSEKEKELNKTNEALKDTNAKVNRLQEELNSRIEEELKKEYDEKKQDAAEALCKHKATLKALEPIYSKLGIKLMAEGNTDKIRLLKYDGRFGNQLYAISANDIIDSDPKNLAETMYKYSIENKKGEPLSDRARDDIKRDCYLKAAVAMAATRLIISKTSYEECKQEGETFHLLGHGLKFDTAYGTAKLDIYTNPQKENCVNVRYNGKVYEMTVEELVSMDPKMMETLSKETKAVDIRQQTHYIKDAPNMKIGTEVFMAGEKEVSRKIEKGQISIRPSANMADGVTIRYGDKQFESPIFEGTMDNASQICELKKQLEQNKIVMQYKDPETGAMKIADKTSLAIAIAVMANPDIHLGIDKDGKPYDPYNEKSTNPGNSYLNVTRTQFGISVTALTPTDTGAKDDKGNPVYAMKANTLTEFTYTGKLHDPATLAEFVSKLDAYKDTINLGQEVKNHKRADYTRDDIKPGYFEMEKGAEDIASVYERYNQNAQMEGEETIDDSIWKPEKEEQDKEKQDKEQDQPNHDEAGDREV